MICAFQFGTVFCLCRVVDVSKNIRLIRVTTKCSSEDFHTGECGDYEGLQWIDNSCISLFREKNQITSHIPWWDHDMKTVPHYSPAVRKIHRSPVESTRNETIIRNLDRSVVVRMDKFLNKQLVIWDVMSLMWRHCYWYAVLLDAVRSENDKPCLRFDNAHGLFYLF